MLVAAPRVVPVASSSSGDGSSSSSAGCRGGSRRGRGGVRIYVYPDAAPVLNGASRCPHCFWGPCIVASPPAFLVGTAPAKSRNSHKCFPLYRKFWRVLDDLGVWRHVEYLERKALQTSTDDVREIMPECVLNVRMLK